MDELHVPACSRYSALKNYFRQGDKLLFRIYRELPNFTRSLYKEFVNTAKKFGLFSKVRYGKTFGFYFRNI